jgi:hypothetical protein
LPVVLDHHELFVVHKVFLRSLQLISRSSNPLLLWKPEVQHRVQKAPVIGSCILLDESNQQPSILHLEDPLQ